MSRILTTTQRLSGTPPVTAVPLTIAGWFYCADTTNFYRAASLSLSSGGNNYYSLLFRGDVSGDPVEFHRVSNSSGAQVIATTSGYSATTWTHAACFASAANAAAVYVGGGSKQTGTTSVVNGGLNDFSLNAQYFSGSYIFSGATLRAAEVGVWSVALDDAEIASLAKGYSPLEIRPASLVAYYPLGGHYGQADVDRWRNRYDLTPSGSPTWADHPRVIYQGPSFAPIKATVASPPTMPSGSLLLMGVGV